MALVTLASGGFDSTLMSLLAQEEGIRIFPLFVDYGQLGADREWKACREVYVRHRLPKPTRMSLAGFGRVIPSGITNHKLRINEDAFLPCRNLLLIVAGAAYAFSVMAPSVAIGLLNPDEHLFPDQTTSFLRIAERAVDAAIGRRIRIVAPLAGFTKRDVLRVAKSRRLHGVYSCHAGTEAPCGACVACVEIKNAKKRS